MEGGAASDSGCGQTEKQQAASDAAGDVRAVIDTSAPFLSVKEAVEHFGGKAKQHCSQDVELVKVKEQTAQLKKDLALKGRETLNIVDELETTKKIANELKLRLQQETAKSVKISVVSGSRKVHPMFALQEDPHMHPEELDVNGLGIGHNLSAELIIKELRLAKVNLIRSRMNHTDIQTSIKFLYSKIQEEKYSVEELRKKLTFNAAVVRSLLEQLNQITQKHQKILYLDSKRFENFSCISQEIKQRSYEIEKSKKATEAAKIEVSSLMFEIEQTKASMKITEIRIAAAKKMKEETRSVRSFALAEIKTLTKSTNSVLDLKNSSEVILSMKEYITLMSKAQEADVTSRMKIRSVMKELDQANQSKVVLLMKVEEANALSKTWKKTLEFALEKANTANKEKLVAEEALWKFRDEHVQKRHNVPNSTKFKSYSAHQRKSSRVLDLNSSSLITEPLSIGLNPPLTIGQILRMRLTDSEECNMSMHKKKNEKCEVCLG